MIKFMQNQQLLRKMKLLIDIGHPAHVHLFKNLAKNLLNQGHSVFFTCRNKEVTIQLLEAYNFDYCSLGSHYKNLFGKFWGLARFTYSLFISAIAFHPDIILSHGSPYAAISSMLLRKPHISLENNGNMEQIRFYLPFTKAVLIPDTLNIDLGKKQINIASFHEIAYLLPKYFRPSTDVYDYLGCSKEDPFCIVRFVSWNASHDIGHKGLSEEEKDNIIYCLEKRYRVFITSEIKNCDKYDKYKIKIPPHLMHHALYYASLVVSEGATMASEAGVLGTPSIYINSLIRSYNEDQEKFGTVFNFRNGTGVLQKIEELMCDSELDDRMANNRKNLLNSKIDYTSFLFWFILNYPTSFKTLKVNPDYQYNFK